MSNTILYLGFSVMAQMEHALVRTAEYHGLRAHAASLGGHLMRSMSHLIDVILDWRYSDAVVLDLTTPDVRPERNNLNQAQWMAEMNNVVQAILARGRRVGLVHLYRSDVNFENDALIGWCNEYCLEHGLMARNLGREVARAGDTLTAGFLRDVVHPTPTGIDFYAEHMLEFGRRLLRAPQPIIFDHQSPYAALAFTDLLRREHDSEITRHGPPLGLVDVPQGEAVTVTIPEGMVSHAMLMAYGPRSGPVRITTEDAQSEIIPAHDAFSYYERLAPVHLKRPVRGRVTFEQLSDLPVEPLAKGDPDLGPRVGKFGYILAS